jgi:hypothetical protein
MKLNKIHKRAAKQDGWVDIMYHGLDAVGVDMQVSKIPMPPFQPIF